MISIIVWILFFITQKLALSDISYVNECPTNEARWDVRDWEFRCNNNISLHYHCILTREGKLVELCIRNVSIEASHDGCPQVYIDPSEKNKAVFVLENSECPPQIEGCPKKGHQPYFSNQLFLYPKCLIPEMERNSTRDKKTTLKLFGITTMEPDAVTDLKSLTTKIPDETTEIETIKFIVIAVLVLVAFTFISVCLARYKYSVERYNSYDDDTSNGFTQNLLGYNSYDDDTSNGFTQNLLGAPKLIHRLTSILAMGFHRPQQDDAVVQAIMLFDIAKTVMWKQITFVKNADRNWEEILNVQELRHSLYHQWECKSCCFCPEMKGRHKKVWALSDKGWHSLYRKNRRVCKKGSENCCCRFEAKNISFDSISIATLFTLTYLYGGFSNEGKRHLKHLRRYCKEYILNRVTEASKSSFTKYLENIMTNVAFHSKFRLVRKMQMRINEIPNSDVTAGNMRSIYQIDYEDTTPFEDTRLDDGTFAAIEHETSQFLSEKDYYVEVPRIISEANRKLREHKLLIVVGEPGDGRKSLCKYLMKGSALSCKLKLDYWQADSLFFQHREDPCLIYFEDILGSSLFPYLAKYEKQHFIKNVKNFLNQRLKDVHVICSIERCKFQDALLDLDESERNVWDKFILNISSSDWKLTRNERLDVLNRFEEKYPLQRLRDDTKTQILDASEEEHYFGFFENCVLCYQFRHKQDVFFEPSEQLEIEINCLCAHFREEFIILTYILLTNKPFDINDYDQTLYVKIKKAISADEWKGQRNEGDKQDFKLLLRTSYDSSNYVFQHQFVRKAILQYCCKEYSDVIINEAVDVVIKDNVRPSTYEARTAAEIFGKVAATSDEALAKRILECVDIIKVPRLASSWDKRFVTFYLLREIEERLKLKHKDSSLDETVLRLLDEAMSDENHAFIECLDTRYNRMSLDNIMTNSIRCALERTQRTLKNTNESPYQV